MARLAVRLFFRRVDVESPYNVPSVGPVLLVANHANALVDPLVLMTVIPRRIIVTAKSTLAANPLLRWLMAACGVITFHREQDVGQGVSRRMNVHSLQECQKTLAQGGTICIFPEGVSHSDPRMRPFRNGAARIALQYVAENSKSGRLRIVPVGLLYTAKDQFRSDVWLRVGNPIDVEKWRAENPAARAADLTRVIEQRVGPLTINTSSRREQMLLTWAAEIIATRAETPRPLGSDDRSTADWFQLIGRLQTGWDWLNRNRPDVPKRFVSRIRAYKRDLRRVGVSPGEVFLPLNVGRAAFFLLRELELMIIGGPLALFGAINHAAPYFSVKWIARKLSRDKDHWASNSIYSSFVVFPFFYLVQLTAAWLLLPVLWASVYTFALPYTGYYAVLYGDRFQRAWRRARTFVRFTLKPNEQQQLATEGRALVAEIRMLGQLVDAAGEPTTGDIPPIDLPMFQLSTAALTQQFEDDIVTLRAVREGLDSLEAMWVESRQSIRARERGYFTPDEDDRIHQMILAYRNYRLILYEIINRYLEHRQLPTSSDQRRAFMIAYAAALTVYTRSIRLIRAYEHEPLIRQKMNEADARFGLEGGFFEELVRAYTSLINARRLAACHTTWRNYRRQSRSDGLRLSADDEWLADVICCERKATRHSLWDILTRRASWDWKTVWRSISTSIYRTRYGLRSFVGGTLGNVHYGFYRPALSAEAVTQLHSQLRPGDILLMRSEQKFTTALLPGFWCHSGLYVGSRNDLETIGLKADPAVQKHWARLAAEEECNGCVIEAISPGVIIRSLNKSLQVDHVAVLRPRLDADSIQLAIADAFTHVGKGYDFEFDFNISTRLVCTELIYRIYHGRGQICFDLTKRLGRYTLTCDDIARTFVVQSRGSLQHAPFDLIALILRDESGQPQIVSEADAFDAFSARAAGAAQFPDGQAVPVSDQ